MISSIDITVIANDELAVTVAPALGGRMIELVDLQSGRRWLWRNHRVSLGSTPSGASYDDVWQGGLEKVDHEFGNLLSTTDEQPWSTEVGLPFCLHRSSRSNEFVYVSGLPEGWCEITDTKAGSWVRIDYPTVVFPHCLIFMTYGGWRERNMVVLEPCTNHPKDLEQAISNGTAAVLAPGTSREFEVTVSVGSANE